MLSRFSGVQLFATLWTAALQAPLSTGFSKQEYWSGLPFPSPISHASNVILKILQTRLRQYLNRELPDVQLDLEKAEEQIANIHWIIEKAREFQKSVYFCFIHYAKPFVWITTN